MITATMGITNYVKILPEWLYFKCGLAKSLVDREVGLELYSKVMYVSDTIQALYCHKTISFISQGEEECSHVFGTL